MLDPRQLWVHESMGATAARTLNVTLLPPHTDYNDCRCERTRADATVLTIDGGCCGHIGSMEECLVQHGLAPVKKKPSVARHKG